MLSTFVQARALVKIAGCRRGGGGVSGGFRGYGPANHCRRQGQGQGSCGEELTLRNESGYSSTWFIHFAAGWRLGEWGFAPGHPGA